MFRLCITLLVARMAVSSLGACTPEDLTSLAMTNFNVTRMLGKPVYAVQYIMKDPNQPETGNTLSAVCTKHANNTFVLKAAAKNENGTCSTRSNTMKQLENGIFELPDGIKSVIMATDYTYYFIHMVCFTTGESNVCTVYDLIIYSMGHRKNATKLNENQEFVADRNKVIVKLCLPDDPFIELPATSPECVL